MTPDSREKRLEEEVRFHLDMATERNIRLGMTPEEARRRAQIEFGAKEHWKDEARNEFRQPFWGDLRKDLRHGIRSLTRHPSFALTVMLTLGLGIGASTAIFSVVNAVLLRPLPYADAGRLTLIWGDMRARHVSDFPFAPAPYRDLKAGSTAFQDIAALTPFGGAAVTVPGEEPEQVAALGVTQNLLPLLGVHVMQGRDFNDGDAAPPPPPPQQVPGAAPVAPPPPLPTMLILNYDYWKRRFGGDPGVIGKTVDFAGGPASIVGVLGPGFEILFPPNTNMEAHPDVIAALRVDYERASRLNVFMRLVGRLKPGATLTQARVDAERAASALRESEQIFKAADIHYRVEPMHEDLVADVRPAIFALMGAVAFVLLIACANVANLLLVRTAAREQELAVRVALGGSSWRIVRQLLTESLVLAVAGAALGLGLAWAGIKFLVALAPSNLPRLDAIHIDTAVLGYLSLAALFSAVLFGLAPAIRSARPGLGEVLRRAGRQPGLAGGSFLRRAVVVAEVALSFVLLVGGGLMVRSFVALAHTSPGFDARGALTFTAGIRGDSPEARAAQVRTMQEQLKAIPGVRAVTAVFPLPLDGTLINSRWGKEEAVTDPSKFQQANVHIVLPGYFEVMGTRLLAGRTYTEADNNRDFTGIVVDELLAKKAFPGENAVGKRLYVRSRGQTPEWLDIIGVVEHERHESMVTEGRMAIFFTDGFFGNHGVVSSWVLRCGDAACNPNELAGAARAVVKRVEPRTPFAAVKPMEELVENAMTGTRFALVLIGVFAAIAAALACIGLYGVLSTAVRQRTAEIGVRVAFGASARNILGQVIADGMKLCALGLGVGLLAAVWLTRAMTTMLVQVQPTDPVTYVAITLLFLLIGVAACWIPARRAAGLDPMAALRSE
ncbi:MAG TPA: ABC transporter permease [Gemmatimonadales bacterium]|nr:ABC transporter permease [Gemmatimonadales bacterium]